MIDGVRSAQPLTSPLSFVSGLIAHILLCSRNRTNWVFCTRQHWEKTFVPALSFSLWKNACIWGKTLQIYAYLDCGQIWQEVASSAFFLAQINRALLALAVRDNMRHKNLVVLSDRYSIMTNAINVLRQLSVAVDHWTTIATGDPEYSQPPIHSCQFTAADSKSPIQSRRFTAVNSKPSI